MPSRGTRKALNKNCWISSNGNRPCGDDIAHRDKMYKLREHITTWLDSRGRAGNAPHAACDKIMFRTKSLKTSDLLTPCGHLAGRAIFCVNLLLYLGSAAVTP